MMAPVAPGGSSRWPWAALAAVCLAAPLVTVVAIRLLAPGLLDLLLHVYTSSEGGPFESHALMSHHGDPLGPWSLGGFRDFLEMIGVETLVRTWNVLAQGALLGVLMGAAAVALLRLVKGAVRQAAAFGLCSVALACVFWPSWGAPILAACALPGFLLNFTLGHRLVEAAGRSGRSRVLVAALSFTGLVHLVAPVVLWDLLARTLRPESRRLRWWALAAGRACFVLVWLCPLGVAYLSGRAPPVSPSVSRIMDTPDLYDLELDRPNDRLIVTRKWRTEDAGGAHAIALGDLTATPRRLDMPSRQVEDVALDAAARRLYLIDIDTRELFILDADTMARVATRKLASQGRGGYYLDVVSSLQRVFVAWEVDLLASYDLATGEGAFLRINPLVNGATNLICDRANKVLYFTAGELTHGYLGYGGAPSLAAVDMKTLKVLRRAPAPLSDRMALAPGRRELYISDPWGSSIWVYSTPHLKLLRKLPAQFAVRPLAVDEEHGVLVAGGVLTGYVEVIDLQRGHRLQRHYVAPMCRRIALDTRRRNAFITTTRGGLHVLRY